MSSFTPSPEVADICKILELDKDALKKYMEIFTEDLIYSLSETDKDKASMKGIVSFLQDLPCGEDDEQRKVCAERGKFLALDLGGTNFRVLVINLSRRHFDMRARVYAVPESIMTGPGEELFDHIAHCLYDFTAELKLNLLGLPLGFTFSFPCEQENLTHGRLIHWTKGFACKGVEGEDVVKLLEKSIAKIEDLKIDVCAILNDTVGTLMSCAWKKINTKIGLIIGTGTNSCYVERVERIPKYKGDKSKPYMIINLESGAFGCSGQLDWMRTDWDVKLDAESINPGINLHEKMISGMYLGDVVRRVMLTATEAGVIFGGKASNQLKEMGSFKTSFISKVEEDAPGDFTHTREVLSHMGYDSPSDQDIQNFRYINWMVWQRGGRMVSASMAAVLNRMDFKDVTIGVDGSLYRFHPGFKDLMRTYIKDLADPSIKFELMLSEDGSGRGAALVAAVAWRAKHGIS